MIEYDVIHFEALGEESKHLQEETEKAQKNNELPKDLKYLITPDNLQDFLQKHPEVVLPDIITTKTHSILPEDYLNGTKKSIITRSAGYDHFEQLSGVANITSLRNYCVNAVAQTAIKFLYSTAGLLNSYTMKTITFDRNHVNSFMELNKNRTATVFGVGKIGKRIYELLVGNGLNVQAVDIRQDELEAAYNHKVHFVSKEEAIQTSDIIINSMNLTRNPHSKFYNVGYFSKEYLSKGKKKFIFINVTRGDIAPESGLLDLYDNGQIQGIGLDVFTDEAAFSKVLNGRALFEEKDHIAAKTMLDRAINRTANIYVQPHQGFNSDIAAAAKAKDTIIHLIAWYKNGRIKFDEQLPYYQI